MANQQQAPGMAPGRTTRLDLRALVHARLTALSLRLSRSVRGLSRSDSQFLWDLRREEQRYPMTQVRRLTSIAASSPLPQHREALPQLFRELIVVERAAKHNDRPIAVDAAFDGETDAQAHFDKAQRRYDHNPTPENHRLAIEAASRQLAWTQVSLDSLYATPPDQ